VRVLRLDDLTCRARAYLACQVDAVANEMKIAPREGGTSPSTPGLSRPVRAARNEGSFTESITTRPRLFYGWTVVACAFAVLTITYGIQFTFGVFMPYISADTGWDRGSLSLCYSLYVFVYSALGLVSGWLTDRLGPRGVLTAGGCLLGTGVLLMSQVQALWQIDIVLGVIAAMGMSAAYVPCNATVARWFRLRRGVALSITSSGTSFGMFIFPPLTAALIAARGWRETYLILGALGIVSIISCATFMVRDPEAIGLAADGGRMEDLPHGAAPAILSPGEWTLAQARRTSAFWLLTLIFTLTWIVVFLPMVHIVPFAVDLGISHFRAAMTISVIGLAGFVGRLGIGTVSDRTGRVPTLGLCLLLQAVAFFGFAICHGIGLLYTAAALFGFSYGGVTALFPALVADLFGLLAVGSIVGFIFAVAGSPAAVGPLVAGYMYNASHSYIVSFELSAALNLAALLLLFFLEKPTPAAA
jgi:MFS transporter, OFA family, oxalate/formate antiporter